MFGPYVRKPGHTVTTYRRAPLKQKVEAFPSDDDSDLDEPTINSNIRSSPNRKLGNNNIINDDDSNGTTVVKHPISNYLDKKLQESRPSYNISFEEIKQQEVVIATQPPLSPHLQVQSQQPALPLFVQSSVKQQLQLTSFSNPSIPNNNNNLLEMDSLTNLYEVYQQPIQYEQQVMEAPFTIPSQSLPSLLNPQLDQPSIGSFGQNTSTSLVSDTLLMQQQQQQQQQFTPLAGNIEKINNASGSIYRDNTPFTPIQSLIQEQQPMIDANGFSNDTNILQRRDVALSVFQNIATSNATTSTPTSTPSSIDIFEIPELPTRHPITRQSSQQSFNTKENKADEYDVFDFPPANDIPKVTKTYKSPARASPSSSSTAKPKKNADTSLDVFDFPEEDSSNIVELKIVSTRSSDTSSSSISKRGNKPLKRSSSQVNMNSTAKVLSRQQQQQQPGKPSPLKKSKSEASAKPSEKRVRFAPEILVSTFHRTSFDRSQPSSAPTFSNEPTYSSEKMGRDTFSFSIPSSSSQQQLPTKRKRNLVSRLRNATGAPSTQASAGLSLRKYNFDDDDDDDNMVEENGGNDEMVQTASATHEDELDYRRKMERELAAMMENEFGQEINEQGEQENGEQENISRPQYQPSNVMNVRVTYKSSKKQQSNSQQLHQQQQLQQDREMVELDNLLDKLRAGSTDL